MTFEPSSGEVREELQVGSVSIRVRHSCVRRDMYELARGSALGPRVLDQLRLLGNVRAESAALLIVEVPGVHQLTVAPASGRVVVMPKLSTRRDDQRRCALEVAKLLAEPSGEP